ncbi:MAG: carboxypeptidase-like regulatory domain-containing protein [Bacteroidetes bacterium]|nr:carboxypeptidase-like regulatory domain-containing protein [Bacteroidota bacterium]
MQKLFLIFFLSIFSHSAFSQSNATVSGVVRDENKKPLPAVSIGINGTQYATVSNEDGSYSLTVPANSEIQLVYNLLGKKPIVVTLNLNSGEEKIINKNMEPASTDIGVVNIIDKKDRNQQVMRIDYRKLDEIPNPSLNFEGILKTLGPVVSNNELSSEYSVRGGNYDENLVYVNDVEIYRPQLVRSGFQEGLTFIRF